MSDFEACPCGTLQRLAAVEAERDEDRRREYGYSQQVVDALTNERDALRAERDAVLKALNAMLTHMGMDEDEWNKPTFDQARAAIKAVEGGGND